MSVGYPFPEVGSTDLTAAAYLQSVGELFATFDGRTQDSGNVSYGVCIDGSRYFVKTAGDPKSENLPLRFEQRVRLLENARILSNRCEHTSLVPLHRIIESATGPMLVYDWVDGELLYRNQPSPTGSNGYTRFRDLGAGEITTALDSIYEAHVVLASAGYIAVDFYDGCFLYDFDARRIRLIDLDHYHRGPFINEMGRMFGSTRYMAPEEFALKAQIDQATTVYNLGRAAAEFLGNGTLDREAFRGPDSLRPVVERACQEKRADRFSTVERFYKAWRKASSNV